MCGEYISVHILDVPYHADCEYTYFVPYDYRLQIELGSVCVVPFGKSNRKKSAIVVCDNVTTPPDSSLIKSVASVMTGYFKLSGEMIEMCRFMKRQTLCTMGEAVRCIIPSAIVSKTKEKYRISDTSLDFSSELYEYIKDNPQIKAEKLTEKFPDCERELLALIRRGAVIKETYIEDRDKSKYETRVFLKVERDVALRIAQGNGAERLRGKKQAEALLALCEYGEIGERELCEMAGVTHQTVESLVKKELIGTRRIEVIRDPYALLKGQEKKKIELSEEQTRAFETLKGLLDTGEPRAALLYGITGSGKTSVIQRMIDEVIEKGRSVIVLVPEISLTPQTVAVFCGAYGDRVAVIHSNLSAGERFDTFKRITDGKADIVIGTRSAVFAPVKNLGMIVIDEEQEHTYKSDTSPKYLAHDIARYRCAKSSALMLLASATPSLNSYYKAMSGVYTLVKLTKRYGEAVLPEVLITDMRKERARGNMSPFGTTLAERLISAKNSDKQSILFLNRRGYHSTVSCQECGEAVECPSCSVAMTYHSYRKITEEITVENAHEVMSRSGVLRCHYCGYHTRLPQKCKCGASSFNYVGFGTQRTQDALCDLIPNIKTLRLDADTTTSKLSYEEILGSFRNKEADALIGTQMVTKGHNFPYVTVVGVVMADTMLYTSDYRAAERTFSMLTQVIGRAGRARDKGIAIIQTNSPFDKTITLAAKQDYESFYENEIRIRKAYTFPPFCDIAMLTLSSTDEIMLTRGADIIMNRLKDELSTLNVPAIAYGPFEAPVYKTQGRYRKRIIVKCVLNTKTREVFSRLYTDYLKMSEKNLLSVDFNPSSI